MAHPSRTDVERLGKAKHQLIVGHTENMEHPWKKAERISGATTTTMPDPPVEAVPQFEIERGARDVPYGYTGKGTTDD